jgi:calnexin
VDFIRRAAKTTRCDEHGRLTDWMRLLIRFDRAGSAVARKAKDTDDFGLYIPKEAKHYGISKELSEPLDPSKGLALQFEARQEKGLECGGAYLKYITADSSFSPESFDGDTPYTVMFGPDKCGGTNKVHLIFRHKSPLDGEIEEKHLIDPPRMPTDEKVHLYSVVVNEDNTYAVSIDGKEEKSGSLFEDFEPPFNPPKEIDDPEDKKPEDWVDEAQIPDPKAKKPSDWDEDAPAMIPDEEAVKPDDWLDDEPAEIEDDEAVIPEEWDVEEDGDWEAPMIPNPACAEVSGCGEWTRPEKPNPEYKGKWYAPMIDNPKYKGEWKPKQIPNPKYYLDETPMANVGKIGAVGLEIWTMSSGLVLDNIAVDNSAEAVEAFGKAAFEAKAEVVNTAVEARAEKAAKEAEKRANPGSPPGLDLFTDLAYKIPGKAGELAQDLMQHFATNPMHYYMAFFTFPMGVIVIILFLKFGRPSAEQKAKKEQKKKDAKKKKDDNIVEEDDKEEEQEGDENEPPVEEKKTPSKRRVRRVS